MYTGRFWEQKRNGRERWQGGMQDRSQATPTEAAAVGMKEHWTRSQKALKYPR